MTAFLLTMQSDHSAPPPPGSGQRAQRHGHDGLFVRMGVHQRLQFRWRPLETLVLDELPEAIVVLDEPKKLREVEARRRHRGGPPIE